MEGGFSGLVAAAGDLIDLAGSDAAGGKGDDRVAAEILDEVAEILDQLNGLGRASVVGAGVGGGTGGVSGGNT